MILYGVEGSKVDADEIVVCLTEAERNRIYGPLEEFSAKFFQHGKDDPAYTIFNKNAVREILERVQPGDILSVSMGNYQESITK